MSEKLRYWLVFDSKSYCNIYSGKVFTDKDYESLICMNAAKAVFSNVPTKEGEYCEITRKASTTKVTS